MTIITVRCGLQLLWILLFHWVVRTLFVHSANVTLTSTASGLYISSVVCNATMVLRLHALFHGHPYGEPVKINGILSPSNREVEPSNENYLCRMGRFAVSPLFICVLNRL